MAYWEAVYRRETRELTSYPDRSNF